MFNKQFLLSIKDDFQFDWLKINIGIYKLYIHPQLEYTSAKMNSTTIHLLGSLFGCQNPKMTNQEILDCLKTSSSIELLLKSINQYSGEFVIIYAEKTNIYLFNDAGSQSEVYYDLSFSSFGSQPKLLSEVTDVIPHEDSIAKEFYNSKLFNNHKLSISNTTHYKNILHLLPNHVIDIKNERVTRFFPSSHLTVRDLNEVASEAAIMINGYLKAVAYRHPEIALAITAGYDSRLLYLYSLELDVNYFVKRLPNMRYNHYDIITP